MSNESSDVVLSGTKRQRRLPRSPPRRVVKLRVQADSEADCLAASARLALALPGCTMQRPRVGRNPRYEGRQQWFAYGELVL